MARKVKKTVHNTKLLPMKKGPRGVPAFVSMRDRRKKVAGK